MFIQFCFPILYILPYNFLLIVFRSFPIVAQSLSKVKLHREVCILLKKIRQHIQLLRCHVSQLFHNYKCFNDHDFCNTILKCNSGFKYDLKIYINLLIRNITDIAVMNLFFSQSHFNIITLIIFINRFIHTQITRVKIPRLR